MSYSYSEKKRIRKNFGRLPKVMKLPKLIETQLDSYRHFLQQDVDSKKRKNQVENGKMMFIYQAQLSFEIWHGIKPKIDKKVLELLEND